jgi:hypothetical protein
MPCDTVYDYSMNIDHIICGGDFNSDLSRINSLHTRRLLSYVDNENLILLDNLDCCDVEFSYESKANQKRSTLDHFMVSHNLCADVVSVTCDHNVHNMSDHSPLSVSFNIDIESVESDDGLLVNDAKLMWSNATNFDIERYKQILDNELIKCTLPVDALYCKDNCCNRHGVMLHTFHDKLINAMFISRKLYSHKVEKEI